jgi:hypothetical protein
MFEQTVRTSDIQNFYEFDSLHSFNTAYGFDAFDEFAGIFMPFTY